MPELQRLSCSCGRFWALGGGSAVVPALWDGVVGLRLDNVGVADS